MKFKSIALIGIGYWGKIHLKYLQKIKKVSINKIYFNKDKKVLREKQLKKFNFTHKLKDILNDRSIKFVDIVTPIKTHADLTIKFLKSGKRVLIEKPLLMSLKQEKIISRLNNNSITDEELKEWKLIHNSTNNKPTKTKKNNYITKLEEKPTYKQEILSGIYVCKPEIFKFIPDNEYFGMDDLIKKLMKKKIKISKYLLKNYWIDIGQLDDYEIAKQKKEAKK